MDGKTECRIWFKLYLHFMHVNPSKMFLFYNHIFCNINNIRYIPIAYYYATFLVLNGLDAVGFWLFLFPGVVFFTVMSPSINEISELLKLIDIALLKMSKIACCRCSTDSLRRMILLQQFIYTSQERVRVLVAELFAKPTSN